MTNKDTIVLVTNCQDITCDFVVQELQARNLQFERLNTDTWLSEIGLSMGFPDRNMSGMLSIFERAQSVYFRRPILPEVSDFVKDPKLALYCQSEWEALHNGLYACLQESCLWINKPFFIKQAENKPYQLQIAEACGFLIPATRITNSKIVIENLLYSHGPLVLKPLRNALIPEIIGESVVFSQKITEASHFPEQSVQVAPLIAQEWIDKAYDLRVTVIGENVYPVRIDSQDHPETSTDWRAGGMKIPEHSIYNLPPDISQMCVTLTRRLNLVFGAIDLVRDHEGRYWFLELNPNGQWAWLETQTGLPLSASIVDLLASGAKHEYF